MSAWKLSLLIPVATLLIGGPVFEQLRDLPDAVVGQKFTADLKVSFGTTCSVPGTNWSVVAGYLPEGMALSAGRLHGVPAAAGAWEFALRASSACSDAIVPVRVTVAARKSPDAQAALISVHSRSRKR
jgi:hypothetical protein